MILDVQELSKGFEICHLGTRFGAFDGVSFGLSAGEFLLLKGPNGAGKSSLLRTIYRSYRPQSGKVMFQSCKGPVDLARAADIDIAALRRDEIGFVTQFLTARPRVTAERLVAEPLVIAGVAAAQALETARAALADFGLRESLWQAYPTTFSGGEQQKVNLARALIAPRRLLLLDEPTASLDVGARAALVRRLAALKSDGVAIIGVFHHPADVEALIDRVIELPGPAQEVRDDVA